MLELGLGYSVGGALYGAKKVKKPIHYEMSLKSSTSRLRLRLRLRLSQY